MANCRSLGTYSEKKISFISKQKSRRKEHLLLCSYGHLVVKVLWENKIYAKRMRI